MNDNQKEIIGIYRQQGLGYKAIANKLDISVNTVKTYCKRNNLNGNRSQLKKLDLTIEPCENCGKPVLQNKHRKRKRFCCDLCRTSWWNSHQDQVNRKANYELICKCCSHTFISYGNSNRKYCSHECYLKDRFGGNNEEYQKH